MKKSIKKLSSIVSMAAIITTCMGSQVIFATDDTTTTTAGVNLTLENAKPTPAQNFGPYATNPGGKVGKEATITIDGDPKDWSEDMLIAQSGAWDIANAWKGGHENGVMDTVALYAAWDNDNVYFAWQIVNTTDTWNTNDGDGSLKDDGKLCDEPLVIALDVGNKTPITGKAKDGKDIWQRELEYKTRVDHVLFMSAQVGNGTPGMFSAIDDTGICDPDDKTRQQTFKENGITYKTSDTCLPDKLLGLKGSTSPDDALNPNTVWVDLKNTPDKRMHNTKYDHFYEIAIPLKSLGITKDYLLEKGIGAMQICEKGSSGMDSVPHDPCFLDNATGEYGLDDSTSHEKDDLDVITVPLASVGKLRDPSVVVDPPITKDPVINDLTKDKKEVVVGDEVKFTCDANDATSYSFTIDGKVVDESEVSKNVLTHKFDKEGTYKVAVTAKGATGTKDATKEIEVKVNTAGDDPEPGDFEISKFTASPKDSCEVEDSVKLEASATGEDEYEYKFTVVDEDDEETVIQDYSSKVVATWTPEDEGSYTLRVYAKVDGSEDSTAISKDIENFEVTAKSETKKLTMDSFDADVEEGTIEPNKEVVFTAEASGSDDITYKYTISKDGGDEEDLESSDGEATWNPDEEGTYVIKVIASKDGYKDAIGTKTYVVKAKEDKSLIAKISTKAKLQQKLGNSVKFTADSENAEGDVTYKFIVNNEKSEYSDKKFSSVLSYDFEPEEAGTYKVYVIAKDSETGKEEKSDEIEITFTDDGSENNELSTTIELSAKSVKVGDTVTITPETENETGDVTYQLLVNGKEEGKAVVEDKLLWTPKAAGTYEISVKAIDESGKSTVSEELTIKVAEKTTNPDDDKTSPSGDNTPIKALGILGALGSAIAVLSRKKAK